MEVEAKPNKSSLSTDTEPDLPKPINPQPNHISALKAAMVMGPPPKSEIKTAETASTNLLTDSKQSSFSCEDKVNVNTTYANSPAATTTKTEARVVKATTDKEMDSQGIKPVVKPRTHDQGLGLTTSGTPNVAINNLIVGMDAIRMETIERKDNDRKSTSVGRDVAAVIGRIDKSAFAASPGAAVVVPTNSVSSSSCPASNASKHPMKNVENFGPASTAHDFGEYRATPKTQRSSRSAANPNRVASASSKVNATTSAKTLTEAQQTESKKSRKYRGEVPLRPSSSLCKPTAASTSKGVLITRSTPLKTTSSSASSSSATRPKMGDAAGDAADKSATKDPSFKEQFTAFSRFGDKTSDGKEISLTNSDKWMKQAHVIDGKKITTTDTSISFKKQFKTAKKINFDDFKKYIDDLATSKKIESKEIQDKLVSCGPPGLSSATKAAQAGVVERLTDTSKYTGSHKERFDATGKGRGIEGRRDVKDTSGYTTAFKSKLGDKPEGSTSPSPVPHPNKQV